jgi:hypothetical protein
MHIFNHSRVFRVVTFLGLLSAMFHSLELFAPPPGGRPPSAGGSVPVPGIGAQPGRGPTGTLIGIPALVPRPGGAIVGGTILTPPPVGSGGVIGARPSSTPVPVNCDKPTGVVMSGPCTEVAHRGNGCSVSLTCPTGCRIGNTSENSVSYAGECKDANGSYTSPYLVECRGYSAQGCRPR